MTQNREVDELIYEVVTEDAFFSKAIVYGNVIRIVCQVNGGDWI